MKKSFLKIMGGCALFLSCGASTQNEQTTFLGETAGGYITYAVLKPQNNLRIFSMLDLSQGRRVVYERATACEECFDDIIMHPYYATDIVEIMRVPLGQWSLWKKLGDQDRPETIFWWDDQEEYGAVISVDFAPHRNTMVLNREKLIQFGSVDRENWGRVDKVSWASSPMRDIAFVSNDIVYAVPEKDSAIILRDWKKENNIGRIEQDSGYLVKGCILNAAKTMAAVMSAAPDNATTKIRFYKTDKNPWEVVATVTVPGVPYSGTWRGMTPRHNGYFTKGDTYFVINTTDHLDGEHAGSLTTHIFDAKTYEPLKQIKHDSLTRVICPPCKDRFATIMLHEDGRNKGKVMVYDMQGKAEVFEREAAPDRVLLREKNNKVEIFIATGALITNFFLKSSELNNDELLLDPSMQMNQMTTGALRFSHDGRFFAWASGDEVAKKGFLRICHQDGTLYMPQWGIEGDTCKYCLFNPGKSTETFHFDYWRDNESAQRYFLLGISWMRSFNSDGSKLCAMNRRYLNTPKGMDIADRTRKVTRYDIYGKSGVFSPDSKSVLITPELGSKVIWYSLEGQQPIEFDQGQNFAPQEIFFSKDGLLMSIASWFTGDKDLTQVKIYDVKTQQEKAKYFLPGKMSSGPRAEPHECHFWGGDNNTMFMHSKLKDGFNTYGLDLRREQPIVQTFEHNTKVQRLFEVCGAYFGATRPDGAVIYDVRNQRQTIDLLGRIHNPTHLALNPVKPSQHALIAGGQALHTYKATTLEEIQK